jgi:hypothetical protein
MAEYHEGLFLIPDHMQASVSTWIEHGQPAPLLMGSFMRAILLGRLFDAFAHADENNANAMRGWALFLHNYAPSACYGSVERIDAWAQRGGLVGLQREGAA